MNFVGGERKVATTAFQRPGLARAWGDGGEDQREHVIEAINTLAGWIHCRCGGDISMPGEYMTLQQAWDEHRGLTPQPTPTYRAEQQATDAEVREFLRRIADEDQPSVVHTSTGMGVTNTKPDIEDIEELVARLRGLAERCTCHTTDVQDCPNYVAGEDD